MNDYYDFKEKVLCLVKTRWLTSEEILYLDEELMWLDSETKRVQKKEEYLTPLIDHLHNDKENGQSNFHYHVDTRFIADIFKDYFNIRVDPNKLEVDETIEYRWLKKYRDEIDFTTPTELISKSKLKHKCIYKGKCPHRGYDLSQVKPDENGCKTCPLHSLKFDKNGNIINPPTLK
jgi:hypothetical protein